MTTINISHGQARPKLLVKGVPVEMLHRHVTPALRIHVARAGRPTVEYRADALGNIEVDDPEDLMNLGPHHRIEVPKKHDHEPFSDVGNGWPLYVGDGNRPVTADDLLFWLDPLKEDNYRNLTEEEWVIHGQAITVSYVAGAVADHAAKRLTEVGIEKYCVAINGATAGREPIDPAGFTALVSETWFTGVKAQLEADLGHGLSADDEARIKSRFGVK